MGMNLRAYWDVVTNLPNYYAKWMLGILCDVTGVTDTVKMKVFVYQDHTKWNQAYVLEQTVPNVTAGYWDLLSGWQILSLPIGTHNDDLWASGNRWRIAVYASSTGTTNDLWIAGAYLFPLDEAYFIAGDLDTDITDPGPLAYSIADLDGDRGVFPYSHTLDCHYSNVGGTGKYPSLTPEVENYFYFALGQSYGYYIERPMQMGLRYRPRGIFLRGVNP